MALAAAVALTLLAAGVALSVLLRESTEKPSAVVEPAAVASSAPAAAREIDVSDWPSSSATP